VLKDSFRLFKNGKEVRLVVLADQRWMVTSASKETGFEECDEVAPAEKMSWRKAKRRVNSTRTALSPNRLVLLRGADQVRSDEQVAEILRLRPWDPTMPPAA
jgi:hypothetical protein